MALGKPQSGTGTGSTLSQYPITAVFAFTVLLALVGLAVLRHMFGSIKLDLGTK
jgi:hypothetical protein